MSSVSDAAWKGGDSLVHFLSVGVTYDRQAGAGKAGLRGSWWGQGLMEKVRPKIDIGGS